MSPGRVDRPDLGVREFQVVVCNAEAYSRGNEFIWLYSYSFFFSNSIDVMFDNSIIIDGQ